MKTRWVNFAGRNEQGGGNPPRFSRKGATPQRRKEKAANDTCGTILESRNRWAERSESPRFCFCLAIGRERDPGTRVQVVVPIPADHRQFQSQYQ